MKRHLRTVLRDKQLKKKTALRDGTARFVVALLPQTFDLLEELLSDCSSSMWYEIQFTIFSALDRKVLREEDQRRVLALVEHYLGKVKSKSGYAAWKAGDLLGDEWNTPETVEILERLIRTAKNVAGRKAALHGMEHAIERAVPSEREKLFSLIRQVASTDPSAEVRRDATLALRGVGCHHLRPQEQQLSDAQPRH